MSKQKWVPVREDYWGFLNVERNGTVLSVSLMADFEQENGYSIVPLPDDLRLCRLVDAEDAAGVSDEVKAAIDTLCQVNEYHSAARVLHAWLAAMETQPQQPQALDMPDGPGWWAMDEYKELLAKGLQAYRTRVEKMGDMGWYEDGEMEAELARIDAALAWVDTLADELVEKQKYILQLERQSQQAIRYSQRNGESEPPTAVGHYWFRGSVNGEQLAQKLTIMRHVDGNRLRAIGVAESSFLEDFTGKWWGPEPEVAPWDNEAVA